MCHGVTCLLQDLKVRVTGSLKCLEWRENVSVFQVVRFVATHETFGRIQLGWIVVNRRNCDVMLTFSLFLRWEMRCLSLEVFAVKTTTVNKVFV